MAFEESSFRAYEFLKKGFAGHPWSAENVRNEWAGCALRLKANLSERGGEKQASAQAAETAISRDGHDCQDKEKR
jgi:hypothetical protein